MKLAIFGPGAIGSTFAWQLSRAGHEVTVVARGARLSWLEKERAIVRADGERAAVQVAAALDADEPWDLVLVTVLAPQVEAVLPSLQASRARRIMFMFNTFEPLDSLRDAVGPDRFSFGFPAGVFSLLIEGKIHPQIRAGTTVSDEGVARLFSGAGIPTVVENDMHSWLRSHAALVAPLMSMSVIVHGRGRGATWTEAAAQARALAAGFDIVRSQGHALVPAPLAWISRLPRALTTLLLWAFSRTKMLRDLGALGSQEPRMLIDIMSAVDPARAEALRAVRP